MYLSPSCQNPGEPLSIDEIADRCHCPEDVSFTFVLPLFVLTTRASHLLASLFSSTETQCFSPSITHAQRLLPQIEMIYKIIQHMAANDRALIAEGSCGSPRSVKVYLGECNVDEDMQAA